MHVTTQLNSDFCSGISLGPGTLSKGSHGKVDVGHVARRTKKARWVTWLAHGNTRFLRKNILRLQSDNSSLWQPACFLSNHLYHQSMYAVSHNCFYYTSKSECSIPDDNTMYALTGTMYIWEIFSNIYSSFWRYGIHIIYTFKFWCSAQKDATFHDYNTVVLTSVSERTCRWKHQAYVSTTAWYSSSWKMNLKLRGKWQQSSEWGRNQREIERCTADRDTRAPSPKRAISIYVELAWSTCDSILKMTHPVIKRFLV